jgi:hypothetical protein
MDNVFTRELVPDVGSVAVTATLNVPAAVGVPVMTPVLVFRDSPDG